MNPCPTHGMRRTRIHNIWRSIHMRCYKPKANSYSLYGERGISVCQEWHKFEPFFEWLKTSGYTSSLTLDRIDANGNYEPNNCRWATYCQQAQNRRNSISITYKGETLNLAEWARRLGIGRTTLQYRHSIGLSP